MSYTLADYGDNIVIMSRCLACWCDATDGCWLEDIEWGSQIGSDHQESRVLLTGEPSTEYVIDDEIPWLVDGDGEERGLEDGRCSVWSGGWVDGWNGRRLASRNESRDGVLSGGSVGDLIWPRSSNRGTPLMPLLNWYDYCQVCNDYSAVRSVHHDHYGYILNGNSDSVGFGGGPIGRGETEHRRRTSSSRQRRQRIVRGTEWF